MAKLDGTAEIASTGRGRSTFAASIYNGNDFGVTDIDVHLTVVNGQGTEVLSRVLRCKYLQPLLASNSASIGPLATRRIGFDLGIDFEKEFSFTWGIAAAKRCPW